MSAMPAPPSSLEDEEFLNWITATNSDPLVQEMARRLAERIDDALEAEDLEEKVETLEAQVASLEASIDRLESTNAELRTRLASQRSPLHREALPENRPLRKTHVDVALGLLPEIGSSMSNHSLTRLLAEEAKTSHNAAGNAIRRLIDQGRLQADGRGAKRNIIRVA